MTEFVEIEVETYCECNDIELSKEQMREVVDGVIADDNWYDFLTNSIQEQLERLGVK